MKYCPLCAAEYRENFDTCATCSAVLVTSLAAARAAANPPRLLWVGPDRREFDAVARALREAGIPARLEEGALGILARLVNSDSRIDVLQTDFDRAVDVANAAAPTRQEGSALAQLCHACGGGCSAALAACPNCKTVLKVEHEKDLEVGLPRHPTAPPTMKYCPLCDAEYPPTHTRCTVCGVELVPEELRGRPLDERQRRERIEVVWRGGDPGAVSQVIHILRDAGIRHHVQPTNDHFVFELGMPRPKYVVRTFASDASRAKELLASIYEISPFGSMEPSALALAQEPLEQRGSLERDWRPAAATVEVWSGEDAALARLLEACLRENLIGVRRQGIEPGVLRLLVMPVHEAAAREIIREVREAAPPG